MRSGTRGWVKLRDANPESSPRICFNYMTHDDDWRHFRYCIRLVREIFAQPAPAKFCGKPLATIGDSSAGLDDFVRGAAESAYHLCGTCKIGAANDPQADSDCWILGVSGLRVVNSSVFPRIPYGNLKRAFH